MSNENSSTSAPNSLYVSIASCNFSFTSAFIPSPKNSFGTPIFFPFILFFRFFV